MLSKDFPLVFDQIKIIIIIKNVKKKQENTSRRGPNRQRTLYITCMFLNLQTAGDFV